MRDAIAMWFVRWAGWKVHSEWMTPVCKSTTVNRPVHYIGLRKTL